MSDDKLSDATVRGARADSLLKDEMLIEAFDVATRAYLDEWMATDIRDQDKRERLYHAVKTVAKVRQHLVTVVNDGKLAKKQIDIMNDRPKRFGII